MTAELEHYLKEINHNLTACPKPKRSQFVKELRGNIGVLLEERPHATIQDVTACFGSPEEISANFLKTLPDSELQRKVFFSQRAFTFVKIVAIILALGLLFLFGYYVYDSYKYTHGETTYGTPTEVAPTPENDIYITY